MKRVIFAATLLSIAGLALPAMADKSGTCDLVDPHVPSSCPGAIVTSKIFPAVSPHAVLEFHHHGEGYAYVGYPSLDVAGFKKAYDETFFECHLRFGYWATVANTTVFTRIAVDGHGVGDVDVTVPVAGTYQSGLSRIFIELPAGPHQVTVMGATVGGGEGVWRYGNMDMDCREVWITPQD